MSEAAVQAATHVGENVQRVDDDAKLTGGAMYASDLAFAGMLHAQVKKSPHARAKILSINTEKAENLPGVHAVLIGKELDYRIGMYVVDKDILAKDVVRHFGEAVAAVAAESLDIASRAVELIDVEYEVLPPVLNQMEALQESSARVHPDLGSYDYVKAVFSPQPGTNIPNITRIRKGDVEAGFAEAKWIIEREYTNPSVQHVPMETHVAIVEWKAGDEVNIWTSAQSPFTVRDLFCRTFKLPHNKVRVVIPHVGGGFGGKAGIHLEPLLACLSRKAGGRPVKFHASREEEFSLLPCRSALTYKIKTGVAANGRITAQKLIMYWDSGAYADYAVNVTRASAYSAAGPYDIPNAWVDAYTIYTNKPWGTAYRGFGHVEFFWGLERHMELVAEVIGMDPLEFRKMNLLRPGSTTITGETITDHTGNPLKCLEEAAKAINYGAAHPRGARAPGPYRPQYRQGHRNIAQGPGDAELHLHRRHHQDELGRFGDHQRRPHRDRPGHRDRRRPDRRRPPALPDLTGEGGRRARHRQGPLRLADRRLQGAPAHRQRRARCLRRPVESTPTRTPPRCCAPSRPTSTTTPRGSSSNTAPRSRSALPPCRSATSTPTATASAARSSALGRYTAQGLTNLDKETGQGLPALDWTYGAHGVIAEVDPETGEYTVIKIASAFDVGKVINPGHAPRPVRRRDDPGPRDRPVRELHLRRRGPPAQPFVHRQQDPHRQGPPRADRVHRRRDSPARRTLRCPRGRRAPDDLGGTGARERHPRRHGRRPHPHAGPRRGRLAGYAQQAPR